MSQVTLGGRDCRAEPQLATTMFDTFAVMRLLHELLWYLAEAVALPAAAPLHDELRNAMEDAARLTHRPAEPLLGLDMAAHRDRVNALLFGASEFARAASGGPQVDHRGADIRGAVLTGCIFLIQSQIDSAKGDAHTQLPPSLIRPSHWSGTS